MLHVSTISQRGDEPWKNQKESSILDRYTDDKTKRYWKQESASRNNFLKKQTIKYNYHYPTPPFL